MPSRQTNQLGYRFTYRKPTVLTLLDNFELFSRFHQPKIPYELPSPAENIQKIGEKKIHKNPKKPYTSLACDWSK